MHPGLPCLARSLGSPRLEDPFPEIDGRSPAIRRLKHDMARVARDPDVTVLLLGESGTGKERIARAIHARSPRHAAPFVVVDCGGLSATLVEDELFGHVRGAFTGALADRAGPFERANGGTVFLDEIGDLGLDQQMKLLRALQQRTVQRLGGKHETAFDVRVIAATNVDLAVAKARGRFREDLYYRLKVYELRVPALRRRGIGDVCEIAGAILRRLAERRQREAAAVSEDVMELFSRYRWPGNVRELENVLERMLVAAAGEPVLAREHLPDDFGSALGRREDVDADAGRGGWREPRSLPAPEEVRAALELHRGSCKRAAAALGLSRHQLYRLLKQFGAPASRNGS